MEKGRIAAHWPNPADAADLFESPRAEERTLIDFCRTPFSFGLTLLIPVALMIAAAVFLLQSRETLTERFMTPLDQGMTHEVARAGPAVTTARRAQP